MANIISIIGLFVCIISVVLLMKSSSGTKILKLASLFLLVFKLTEYAIGNAKGEFSYPIEISTITYFMFSITILFNIKKCLHIASFFATLSGVGFFVFYSLFGSSTLLHYDIGRHIISVICHGILLIGGIYLFLKNEFKESNKYDIYIVMLAILGHASIFYIDSIKNTTFIYYLIKPEFLKVFSSLWKNHLIQILYYFVLLLIFSQIIVLFYKLNKIFFIQKSILSNRKGLDNWSKFNTSLDNKNIQ